MEKGEWFLECKMRIWGEDSGGSGRDITDTLRIQLSAEDHNAAKLWALSLIGKFTEAIDKRDWKVLKQYCGELNDGENIEFKEFKLLMEEPLVLTILKLDGSP